MQIELIEWSQHECTHFENNADDPIFEIEIFALFFTMTLVV